MIYNHMAKESERTRFSINITIYNMHLLSLTGPSGRNAPCIDISVRIDSTGHYLEVTNNHNHPVSQV